MASARRLSVLVVLLGLLPGASLAQTRFAALVGDVTDTSGAVIVGADVKVVNQTTEWQRTVKTDSVGHFVIDNIPPGLYDITVSSGGMQTEIVIRQPLFVGTTTGKNFTLKVGTVTEQVTATATAALIEPTKNQVGQVIQRSEVDSLPVLARDFTSLALLTPMVQQDPAVATGALSIGGQRGFDNDFLVDGVTNRHSYIGTQLLTYAQDWVEEFRVSTSAYEAEFGGASGGVINAITRSGGNRFHLRAYGYVRDDGLDATPAFVVRKPQLRHYRPGGYLSGPLVEGKLFFFTGFEYLKTDSAAIVTSSLEPCTKGTRDHVTGNCVAPTGSDQKLFLAKADWIASGTHFVNGRLTRQLFSDFNGSVGGLSTIEHGRFNDNRFWSLAGAWTTVLNTRATNEMRFVANRAYPFGGTNAGNTFEIVRPSGSLGSPVNHGAIAQDWIQLLDNVSIVRADHAVTLGGSYSNVRIYGDFRNFRDGRYTFNTDKPLDLSDPSTFPLQFTQITGPTTWDGRAHLGGLFVQDSWRVAPRVTVNYGLRFDTDNSLAISGAQRVNTWSPRLGLALALDRRRSTVVRIGGGVFHDAEHTNLAAIFILNTLLADQNISLSGNPAQGAQLNPLYDPADPVGSAARLRLFLAQAFAKGQLPDVSVIGVKEVTPSLNGIDRNFTVPHTSQIDIGLSRLVSPALSMSADVVYARGSNLLVWRDENVSLTGQRLDPRFASILNASSTGTSNYRALALRAEYRRGSQSFGASYTLAKCNDNTSSILTGTFATNPYNVNVDRGPCDNDVRHTLVARGAARLPLDFEVSSILTARSAPPYSATSSPLPLFTRFAARNSRRGSGLTSWDARIARPIRFKERYAAYLFWESYNLLNHRNWSGYVGNALSPRFGQPATASPPRQTQVGVRFDF